MLRRFVFLGLVVAALATVGIAAAPQATPAAFPGMSRLAETPLGRLVTGNIGRLLVLRSQLDVTPEQRSEIRGVLLKHCAEIAATVKSVRDQRLVLCDAVLAENTDEAQIRAAAEQLGTAIGDAAVKAAKLRTQLAPILTDEQIALIREFRQDRDEAVDRFLARAMQGE